ncbi:MAG TPA: 23S rRNA (guanosine(2251)-2'-O)-methyltransferase RlmB [Pyrinomonadaceae bacterium]|jgi:23S rRNA (guanosine2251-2'-O)-methyltransferase
MKQHRGRRRFQPARQQAPERRIGDDARAAHERDDYRLAKDKASPKDKASSNETPGQHPSQHQSHPRTAEHHPSRRTKEHPSGERDARPSRAAEPRFASEAAGDDEPQSETQLYGLLPVLEALRAGSRQLERITLAEGAHEHRLRELLELSRQAGVPVRRAPRAELQRMAAGANHQGVIASVAAAAYLDPDELLDSLAARIGTNEPPLALVLDGVEDPRNLGAIVRTAECAGAHALFLPERRAAGLTDTVAKAAAGALEYVPVARATNVVRLVEELKRRGIWTIGTAADAPLAYDAWDWTQPSALLLGGEGAGLRRLVRERCDALVRIPLHGRIASLNVSVAAGVVLYEALRQRKCGTRNAE